MKFKKVSISRKLVRLFLFLILPLMLIGTMIIHYNTIELEKSIIAVTQQSLETLKVNLEQEFLAIQGELIGLVYNANRTEVRGLLAYYEQYSACKYFITVRSILRLLQDIRSRHDLIEDIIIYYPDFSQSISLKHGLRNDINSEISHSIKTRLTTDNTLHVLCNNLYVVYSLPQSTFSGSKYLLLMAKISTGALKTKLLVAPYAEQPIKFIHKSGLSITNYSLGNIEALNKYKMFSVESVILHTSINKFLLLDQVFATSNRLSRLMLFFMLFALSLFISYSYFIKRLVKNPVEQLLDGMAKINEGKLDFRISNQPNTEEFALLTTGMNNMMDQLNILIEANYQQEIDTRRLELKHLQAQIDPHFLYNSLYTLRHMITCDDNENAVILVQYLGDYFHYMASTDKMEIPLSQEYEHARNYLFIQCMRFSNKLVSECQDLPIKWCNIVVPKLIIQPLYENVIKHAVQRDNQELLIRTTFRNESGYGIICVEDNGVAIDEKKLSSILQKILTKKPNNNDNVTALYNIQRRLQLRYNNSDCMKLSHSELGGLRVELLIPLE